MTLSACNTCGGPRVRLCQPSGKVYNACRPCDNLRSKRYQAGNKAKVAASRRAYYIKHRDRDISRVRKYQKENPDQVRAGWRNRAARKKTDLQLRLRANLRSRIAIAVRRGIRSGSAVNDLGCSLEALKQYIESKFQPGMTWDNYGLRGWHIDHIRPLASFDLTDRGQFIHACHYTNLQPLWATDNLKKSNKWS